MLSKADRQAIEIPEEVLAALPRKRDKGYWTYERCLRALVEFLQAPGADPSLRSYQTLSNGKGGLPSSSGITRHATWSTMVDAARYLLLTGEILPLDQIRPEAGTGS